MEESINEEESYICKTPNIKVFISQTLYRKIPGLKILSI